MAVRASLHGASDAAVSSEAAAAVEWGDLEPDPPPLVLELHFARERHLRFEAYDVTGRAPAEQAELLRARTCAARTQRPFHLCELVMAGAAGCAALLLGTGGTPNGYELCAALADGWPVDFAPTSRIILGALKRQADAEVEPRRWSQVVQNHAAMMKFLTVKCGLVGGRGQHWASALEAEGWSTIALLLSEFETERARLLRRLVELEEAMGTSSLRQDLAVRLVRLLLSTAARLGRTRTTGPTLCVVLQRLYVASAPAEARRSHPLPQRTLECGLGDAALGQLVLHLEGCGVSAETEYCQVTTAQHEAALALLPTIRRERLEVLREGRGGLARTTSDAASPKTAALRVTIRRQQRQTRGMAEEEEAAEAARKKATNGEAAKAARRKAANEPEPQPEPVPEPEPEQQPAHETEPEPAPEPEAAPAAAGIRLCNS
eukprot:SAG11_NODE_5366_length_1581_cov_1.541161_1_plen_433_part_00